jgi:hypothetical protein
MTPLGLPFSSGCAFMVDSSWLPISPLERHVYAAVATREQRFLCAPYWRSRPHLSMSAVFDGKAFSESGGEGVGGSRSALKSGGPGRRCPPDALGFIASGLLQQRAQQAGGPFASLHVGARVASLRCPWNKERVSRFHFPGRLGGVGLHRFGVQVQSCQRGARHTGFVGFVREHYAAPTPPVPRMPTGVLHIKRDDRHLWRMILS